MEVEVGKTLLRFFYRHTGRQIVLTVLRFLRKGLTAAYGSKTSWMLFQIAFPPMMMASCVVSSIRQPPGSHCRVEKTKKSEANLEKKKNYRNIFNLICSTFKCFKSSHFTKTNLLELIAVFFLKELHKVEPNGKKGRK